MQFSHLHCHTQYSVLDGAANIAEMVSKAKADGMPAVAITDHGNMFGVFEFVNECNKQGIKPIIGCEFYLVEDMHITSFAGTGKKDKRYHQLLLAKNAEGYKNLATLCSLGYKEGLFGKYPRIDLNLLKKHKEGIIATSCCIGAIVPQTILSKGEEEGEKVFKEWLNIFGDDYFLELQRHNIQNINGTGMSQEDLNQIFLKWSNRYNVPAICTNDSHYVEQEDAEMHDILLCVNTGTFKDIPIKSDEDEDSVGRESRFGFPNDQFFFKTTAEMENLFSDVPQTLENTLRIVERVEPISLMRDVMMPNFTLPKGFENQQEYMRFLVYEGAKRKYGQILPAEVIERLELELNTIFGSKFEGYFLVIEDFLKEARRMDVWVGPGRGSAAGSAVAYCLDITLVDPIKYGLLFERFLNPERVSFPDIDIDFEDEGRQRVLDYVVEKYGRNNVSQIITFGTMKEKSAIRDVGRVLRMPLSDVNIIAKNVPDTIALKDVLEDEKYQSKKDDLKPDEVAKAEELRKLYQNNSESKKIIDYALKLKGSIRNTGVHACGVIIAPENLESLIPLSKAKDSEMFVTQYDNRFVEKAGLLKMDFLGLKTLNIMKSTVEIIRKRHGFTLNLEDLPLDDEKTFKVFQDGNTDGIFQFESPGMKKSLIGLKPDRFTDLIAMNALYRPGPLDYIPNYIARKHGTEAVQYDIEASKEILEETFGIMVYQEQVMQLSQKLANFTKGQADSLRKAMGKKIKEEMDKLYTLFIDGCKANNHDEDKAKKIWQDMEKFAQYAFNKSHSTCYALIAYQCAYMKAHFPSEFMAGLVSNNMDDIAEVGKYMNEARNMGIKVLGPDVNESSYRFTVNKAGDIRFGLSAIKGVGEELVKELEQEREANGAFTDIFNFVERLSGKVINKRVLEPLAKAGAFDSFLDNGGRERLYLEVNGKTFVEQLLQYASSINNQKSNIMGSLFGEAETQTFDRPNLPQIDNYSDVDRLNDEKSVLGFYLSGHPLDPYKKFIEDCCFNNFTAFDQHSGTVYFGGMVLSHQMVTDKQGKDILRFTIQNFQYSYDLKIKKDNLIKYRDIVQNGKYILIKLKKASFIDKSDGKQVYYDEVQEISLLEDWHKLIQSVYIKLDASKLSLSLIHEIKNLIMHHTGKTSVYLSIYDGVQAALDDLKNNELDGLLTDPEEEFTLDNTPDDDNSTTEPNIETNSKEFSIPSEPKSSASVQFSQKTTYQTLDLLSRNLSIKITDESIADLTKVLGINGFELKM